MFLIDESVLSCTFNQCMTLYMDYTIYFIHKNNEFRKKSVQLMTFNVQTFFLEFTVIIFHLKLVD